jgi:hypothetical protein
LPVTPFEEAFAIRNDRRLRSLGVAPAKGPKQPLEPIDVGPAGLPATIEGSDVAWRIHPDVLPWLDEDFEGRTALLSPFDRLVVQAEVEAPLGLLRATDPAATGSSESSTRPPTARPRLCV